LLITGCGGSDEAALVTAQYDNVLPGACTEAGPKVTLSNPTNNEENVAIGTTITATFDEAMDPTTIAYTNQNDPQVITFTLRDNDHPLVNIEGTVAMPAPYTIATFTPTEPLSGDSWYTVTITTYAKSSAETKLGCSYKWSFKTAL
jgi:methionine-rich copper-binding protein CopC